MKRIIQFVVCASIVSAFAAISAAYACPFCSVESKTVSEDTNSADAVVIAKLVKDAPDATNADDPNAGMATFQIAEVLKNKEGLKPGQEISVVFFGDSDRTKSYLVTGLGTEKIDWATPLPLTPAAVDYVRKLPNVPASGAERLEFFQDYLEHPDPLLSQDAYDEFGRAPYAEVHLLKDHMYHDKIVKWVSDPEVSPSRRRLYLTMLGVCGTKDDVPMLEEMIVSDFDAIKPILVSQVSAGLAMGGPLSLPAYIEAVEQDERQKKLGLDALVACYLILRGPEGLSVVEDRFLKNPKAEYTHVYSTIMALRFHGDENTGVIPRQRLLGAMRLLLKNPEFADQVILDLSRWEDWAVLDQLVEMFKTSDAKGYVRQPVVSYLTVASEQPGQIGEQAKVALSELEKLDPETVKTARSLMAFGALGRARGVNSGSSTAAAKDGSGTSAGTDAKQGFAASPEDDKVDASQIPDPATFGQTGQGGKNGNGSAATSAEPPTKPATETTAKENTAVASQASATTTPAAQPAVATPTVSHVNPLIVAGAPLIAAVLLMGVYWLILRAGAV
jgi:hypothetical protein